MVHYHPEIVIFFDKYPGNKHLKGGVKLVSMIILIQVLETEDLSIIALVKIIFFSSRRSLKRQYLVHFCMDFAQILGCL